MSNSYKKIYIWCKNNYLFIVGLFILFLLANLFLYQFYHQERFIYAWDYAEYNLYFSQIVNTFNSLSGFFRAILRLFGSIAFNEHNILAPFIISPIGLLFGTSRMVYLFSVLNIFGLGSALILGVFFVKNIVSKTNHNWLYGLLPISIILLTPQFWIPILMGFCDVSTLIVVVIIWWLMLYDWQNRPWTKFIAIGILLALLVLIRRWFGYWAVSFFPALLFQWLYCKIRGIEPLWTIKNMVICGFAAGCVFLIFAAPISYHMLTTDYSNIYSAYKFGNSTWRVMSENINYYGWLSVIFAISGIIWALRDKKLKQFFYVVSLQGLIAFLLFSRVQMLGSHHQYQFMILIVLAQAIFVYKLWQIKKMYAVKFALTALFFTVLLINFFQAVVPQFPFNIQTASMFTVAQHRPLQSNDIPEIRLIIDYLMNTVSLDDQIYVVASSHVFNDSILQNYCLYFDMQKKNICDLVMPANHVDRRDGFPDKLLQADYVIVADPIQYHLRPEDQQIVRVLAEQFINYTTIAAAFEQQPAEFMLNEGVDVKIYKKIRPLQSSEVEALKQILLQIYPESILFRDK